MNLSPYALLHVCLTCLPVLMDQNAFLNLKHVMAQQIVTINPTKVYMHVLIISYAQLMSLLVLMDQNAFPSHTFAMELGIVGIVQMNLSLSAPHHV